MKVPISLLKEYLDFSLSPQELAEVFTLAGIEVEGIETLLEPYQDSVLDIALTPNLGHCMSTYGLARELGALLNLPIKNKPFTCIEEGNDIDKLIHVTIIDRKQCLRYACRVISGICVGPSPRWLQERLQMYGMRSINNVVDISNLVMLEWGQPLHIFDYDKIAQKKILVHAQTSFSHLQTLDEQLREIPPESLLICDPEKALAFAGVMGGKSSAVTEETRNILIESAYFTPQAIRKTGKWLGLRTEAGQRFEKGVDPNAIIPALNYAAYQLREVAGGKIAVGYIDQKVHAFEPKKIACRLSRINGLLGTQLSLRQAAQLLERLGIEIQERQTELIASLPTYRNDLSIEEDLIEEIARIYGYNNIQKSIPSHSSSTLAPASSYTLESRVRHGLLNEGLQEFLNCDLITYF